MEHKSDNDYDHDNRYETDGEHADETDNNKKQITSVWGNLGGNQGGPWKASGGPLVRGLPMNTNSVLEVRTPSMAEPRREPMGGTNGRNQ